MRRVHELIPFSWPLPQKRSQRMNVLGSHSPLHHSSLNSGTWKLPKKTNKMASTLTRLFPNTRSVTFPHSHPHSSVVVPRQNNPRRIPSHHPPAGTSGRVLKKATNTSHHRRGRNSTHLSSSHFLRLFLVRVSQSNPKAFVLTLCHHQKIKHFQILPVRADLLC